MNDKIYFNLESEISRNYKQVDNKRKKNDILDQEQRMILKDIGLMLEIVQNEQKVMNKQYLEVIQRDNTAKIAPPSELNNISSASQSKKRLSHSRIYQL